MNLLNYLESLFTTIKVSFDDEFTIYKNPSVSDMSKIVKEQGWGQYSSNREFRGLYDVKNDTVYLFSWRVLHQDVYNKLSPDLSGQILGFLVWMDRKEYRSVDIFDTEGKVDQSHVKKFKQNKWFQNYLSEFKENK